MHKCNHKAVQWLAWENGLYRMYCASCGKYLGAESYMPLALKGFVEEAQMDIEKYDVYELKGGVVEGKLVIGSNGLKELSLRNAGHYTSLALYSKEDLDELKTFIDNAVKICTG